MASVSGGDQSPETNGNKRKSEDGGPGAGQGRGKRNRYISIACNECKRRKIKCNGQMPCNRCGNLNLDCVYAPNCCASSFKDSDEFKNMSAQIETLQKQVDTLYTNMNHLRAEFIGQQQQQQQQPSDPSLPQHSFLAPRASIPPSQASPGAIGTPARPRNKSQSASRPPTFRGPTSTEFNLGVAKHSLQTMGITPGAEEGFGTRDVTPTASPPPDAPMHASKDPIWAVPRDDAFRLLRVYEDEMHDMYPVVPLAELTRHTDRVYTFMETAARKGLVQTAAPGADTINDDDTNLLKLVLATSMVVEGLGRSEMGKRLYDFVQPTVDALLLGHAGIKGVRILALTAMYEFHCDNEGTSWRVIGLTTRLCIELGLHRKETYDAMTEEDRNSAVLLFWAIYCLDRRWSFGTGMPFALQDSDIDPNLPKPDETQSAYLKAMIEHFAIASKVWHAIGSETSDSGRGSISNSEVEYLDYQIMTWHRKLPPHLYYLGLSAPSPSTSNSAAGAHRPRVILYLRANNMRIHLYRPVLHSATSIMSNQPAARTVVGVAKDTIRTLRHISSTTQMYHASQVLFNAFMVSALAVLFLAVSHAPALFAQDVREEFYMALDLVRGLSRKSWVSKRLWRTIRVLKEVGPKLGLSIQGQTRPLHMQSGGDMGAESGVMVGPEGKEGMDKEEEEEEEEDESRSAAVAMAGLRAGGQRNVDENALFSASSATPSSTRPPYHHPHPPTGLHHQQQHQQHQNHTSNPQSMNQHLQHRQHPHQQQQQHHQQQFSPWSLPATSPDGNGMVADLSTLFEATANNGFGGGYTAESSSFAMATSQQQQQQQGMDGGVSVPGSSAAGGMEMGMMGGVFGGEDELSRIMRDLF